RRMLRVGIAQLARWRIASTAPAEADAPAAAPGPVAVAPRARHGTGDDALAAEPRRHGQRSHGRTAGPRERDPLGHPATLDGERAVAPRQDELGPVALAIAARRADDRGEAAERALVARDRERDALLLRRRARVARATHRCRGGRTRGRRRQGGK